MYVTVLEVTITDLDTPILWSCRQTRLYCEAPHSWRKEGATDYIAWVIAVEIVKEMTHDGIIYFQLN